MNKIQTTLPELLNMLRTAQAQFKGNDKEGVLSIASTSRSFRRRSTSKKKKKLVGPKKEICNTPEPLEVISGIL